MVHLWQRRLFGITFFLKCAISSTLADDYELLEKAFKDASVEVNKLNIPSLIYRLDQKTARQYFQRYFASNYMTHALRANIGYPIFHWGDNHETLQKAISPVLLAHLQEFFAKHNTPKTISASFAAEPELHNHIFCILAFFVDIANSDKLNDKYKLEIQNKLYTVLRLSCLQEQRHAEIHKERYPCVNSVKTQFLMTCFTFAKKTHSLPSLSRCLSLPGSRKRLLDVLKVLVLDNCGFDNTQLLTIKSYVTSIPNHLRIPVAITCFDYLISPRNKLITVHDFRCNGAFNVFGSRVGARSGNEFPEDYKKVESDGFTIVLAHEYNHNVDAVYVESTEELKAFKEKLLKKAGSDHRNYLRSMLDDGFFQKCPQEFLASMANQYFCSSKDMLLYALQKAREGNLNQINQFVLMASIYSDATKTYFYRIDKQGNIRVANFPIKKENGLIPSLSLGTKRYSFNYSDGVIDKVNGI